MTLYKSGAQLKDLAKCKLERNYGISIFALLTVGMLELSASLFLDQIIPCRNIIEFIIYLFAQFIMSAFLGIFQTGICLFFLNMACGQPYKLDQLFYGFQNTPKGSLYVSSVTGFISFCMTLPFRILFYQYVATGEGFWLYTALIALILSFLFLYPLTLAFSQSFFLLLDFPDYTGKQALGASMRIMKKQKIRFFLLQLSFLPLIILSTFTCYIGLLWVIPYMNMTNALFFLDIMKPSEEQLSE